MDLGLRNRRALVTGASRGLGAATAAALAADGARVVINSRRADALEKAAAAIRGNSPGEVIAIAGDLSLPDTAAGLLAATVERLGGLDILVTNTGGPPPGAFESLDDAAWQKAVDLLLLSTVRLVRAALPALRQSDAASILTITSYAVKQPIANLVLSNAVRASVIGLTKSLALELGPQGIRVNSILPAWTETERVEELMADRAGRTGTSVAEQKSRQAAESPFGRMARPEEFAKAAAFLSSPAASYITGVMLTVDGGMYKGTL